MGEMRMYEGKSYYINGENGLYSTISPGKGHFIASFPGKRPLYTISGGGGKSG